MICGYAPNSVILFIEKEKFYNGMTKTLDMRSIGEPILVMGEFNGHVGKLIE